MTLETPTTIRAWADATFGPRTPLRALARAHAEMSELLLELTGAADPARLLSEAADVAIVLCTGPWLDEWPGAAPARLPDDPIEWALIQVNVWINACVLATAGHADQDDIARTVRAAARRLHSAFPALWSEVERKMALNRQRTWTPDGFGTGQHKEQA